MEFLTANMPEIAAGRLQAELARFGKDKNQSVNLSQFGWENIWRELLNVAIYRRGPDIAEIGSTWLESLVAMQSLNSFSARDLAQIGGKEVFFPAAWQNVTLPNQKEIYAIPFRADARVIFYWKDLFENASVDAAEAFLSNENMLTAFTRLQAAGIPAWIAPTDNTHNTIYNIASWVWGAGGDFLSADGKSTEINSPAAKRGVHDYFDLLRFMPQQTAPFTDNTVLELFFARKAASIVAGPWLLNSLRMQKDLDVEALLPLVGTALLPGPSFVGGTLLVSWKHSKYPLEAVEFIKRLTSPEFQSEYCHISGLLPVRQNLLADESISSVFNQSLSTGRGLPPVALWGMIEDRLSKCMADIWQDLYTLNLPGKPIAELDEIISKHFEALSYRLDMTLSTPHNS